MAAKPSTAFTWATDATYTGGTEAGEPTKTAPSPSKRAEGWEPAEEPGSETLNHALNHLGTWTEYLSDGDLDGPISITMGVGEALITPALTIDVDEGTAVEILNDVDFNIVDGRITTASLVVTGSAAISGNLGIVGTYTHGDRKVTIAGAAGRFDVNSGAGGSGAVSRPGGGYGGTIKVDTAFASGAAIVWDVTGMIAGDRIKTVTLRALDGDGVTAPAIGNVDVWTRSRTGVFTSIGALTNVALTGTLADVTVNVTDTVLADGDMVCVGITGTVSQNVEIQSVETTYDRA